MFSNSPSFEDDSNRRILQSHAKYFDAQISNSDSLSTTAGVKGRLKQNVGFWENTLKAPDKIIDILKNGFRIPFLQTPDSYSLKNNRSASEHADFVSQAIGDLLKVGSVLEVPFVPYIVSPLSVAVNNSSRKKRLILDLSVLNKFLWKDHFKFEDWKTAKEFIIKDGHMFKFDITSAYHHIDIAASHHSFLGFSWIIDGSRKYFVFTVLPFGLSVSPFVFTKCVRPLVKYVRQNGVRLVVFLDDGWGVNRDYDTTLADALFVKSVLVDAGFIINIQKSVFLPTQILEWLGLVWDLIKNTLSIPDRRVSNALDVLHESRDNVCSLHVRLLAKCTGKIMSMMPVLENICKLRTKRMHMAIESRMHWDSFVDLNQTEGSIEEIKFWIDKFLVLPVRQLFPVDNFESVDIFSDASSVACGAFIEGTCMTENVCHRNWSAVEKTLSSTWREMMTVFFAIKSFLPLLLEKHVRWCTDSQSSVKIIESGSMKKHLQDLAIDIFKICSENRISLHMIWVPRELNEKADLISKYVDVDDWSVSDEFFTFLNDMWGPHSIDRFANHYNHKIPRFNSLCWVPGTENVDSFSLNWSGENNWLVPPVSIVTRVINHLVSCKAVGTLVVPFWPSAPFWPLIFGFASIPKMFILDILEFATGQNIFIQHLNKNCVFGTDKFTSKVLAVRFDCTGQN